MSAFVFIITDKYPTFVTRILMLYGKYFVSFEHFFIDKISNSRYLKGWKKGNKH